MIEDKVFDTRTGYDSVKAKKIADRQKSDIIHLKTFNNWIKAYLISKYCPMHATILDLASGKGGDVKKYVLKKPSKIVFADISPESVAETCRKIKRERSQPNNSMQRCETQFIIGDTFKNDLKISEETMFHFTSCQMALHYSFKDEETARQAIHNLTSRLLPGGFCVITTINACKLVSLLRRSEQNAYRNGTSEYRNRIGNRFYTITRNFELNRIKAFGSGYVFQLIDAVVPIEEYLVHPQILINLFAEQDCSCIDIKSFHEFYGLTISGKQDQWQDQTTGIREDAKSLFLKMFSFDPDMSQADMTPEEWDIIGLYSFYVFQKRGSMELPKSQSAETQPQVGKTFNYIDAETGEIRQKEIND